MTVLDWMSVGGFAFTVIQTFLQAKAIDGGTTTIDCIATGYGLYFWSLSFPLVAMSGIMFGTIAQAVSESKSPRIRLPILVISVLAGTFVLTAAWYGSGCLSGRIFGQNVVTDASHTMRLCLTIATFAACAYAISGRLQEAAPSGPVASQRRGEAILVFCVVGTVGVMLLAHDAGATV